MRFDTHQDPDVRSLVHARRGANKVMRRVACSGRADIGHDLQTTGADAALPRVRVCGLVPSFPRERSRILIP